MKRSHHSLGIPSRIIHYKFYKLTTNSTNYANYRSLPSFQSEVSGFSKQTDMNIDLQQHLQRKIRRSHNRMKASLLLSATFFKVRTSFDR